MTNQEITPDLVQQMADRIFGMKLSPSEPEMVSGLLNALKMDMSAMGRMDVGTAEPATVYSTMERTR